MINKLTQQQKLNIFKEILYKYPVNSILSDEDKINSIELFKNHPNWKIKEGSGIKNIRVILDKFKHKTFLIERIDNSTTDISIIVSSRGYTGNIKNRIQNACRFHITQEIFKFKDTIDFSNYVCPITQQKITKDSCHIDHYNLTFNELFNKWIKDKDIIEISKFLNDPTQDNIMEDKFIDNNIISEFINFHNSNTHLRAVSKSANLSILKRKNTHYDDNR